MRAGIAGSGGILGVLQPGFEKNESVITSTEETTTMGRDPQQKEGASNMMYAMAKMFYIFAGLVVGLTLLVIGLLMGIFLYLKVLCNNYDF